MIKSKTIEEYYWEQADQAVELRRENEILRGRLARYEEGGPALLVAEHASDCNGRGQPYDPRSCECDAEPYMRGAREQHARCVAVVERVLADLEATNSAAAVGARRALAALTG